MEELWPRGLRREKAAAYLGISSSLFDRKRKEGAIPEPREMFGVTLWDRHDLDSLFSNSGYTAANDNNPWDSIWSDTASRNMLTTS